jgi:hypothetical protein
MNKNSDMKRIVYFIILIAAVLSSCKDMDSRYEEYVIPNGIVYPQRADSLKIYPGLNCAKLTWFKAKDPKVIGAIVYWNNYTDSLDVDISTNTDIVSVMIDSLAENTYTFHVKTFDAKGNFSIPSEVTGVVYGENYILTLSSRQLTMNAYYDRVELNWGTVSKTVTKVSILYTSSSNQQVEKDIPLDETQTVLRDYKPGGAILVRTYHLPAPTALNEIPLTDEMVFPDVYELNKAGWKVTVSDSLLRSDTPGGIAIIDGDINVMWHSHLDIYYPHRVELDMKSNKVIARFELCQNPSYIYTRTFTVQFSTDNINWSDATNLVFPGTAAANARQSLYFDPPVEARYVRIESIDGFASSGGNKYAMIMEVYVYGHD